MEQKTEMAEQSAHELAQRNQELSRHRQRMIDAENCVGRLSGEVEKANRERERLLKEVENLKNDLESSENAKMKAQQELHRFKCGSQANRQSVSQLTDYEGTRMQRLGGVDSGFRYGEIRSDAAMFRNRRTSECYNPAELVPVYRRPAEDLPSDYTSSYEDCGRRSGGRNSVADVLKAEKRKIEEQIRNIPRFTACKMDGYAADIRNR